MDKRLFILLVLSFWLTACEESGTNTAQNNSAASSPATTSVAHEGDSQSIPPSRDDGRPYNMQPLLNTWPKLPENNPVAEDLLQTNYYVVLDGSGSMAGGECGGGKLKIYAAMEALEVFASQIPASANLGLLVFDKSGLSERVALSSNNKDQFVKAIKSVIVEGGTPLLSAIRTGYQALSQQAKAQLGYGEYHLVIVTDGEANLGEEPESIVEKIGRESPVMIHTIGFCINEAHSLNQPGIIDYKAANNPQSLQRSLEQVLAESEDFPLDTFGE
ncbi:vWA domain-containing protein [Zooshikella sp. RANM57]|uniref:vWA domain-containing protein n=1 Tax=Zooshikella sp. RANM57 TaxID=3425863 RepID=UPI003D6DF892